MANHDVLSLMPRAFGRLYRDAYLQMVAYTPEPKEWDSSSSTLPMGGVTLTMDVHSSRPRRDIL